MAHDQNRTAGMCGSRRGDVHRARWLPSGGDQRAPRAGDYGVLGDVWGLSWARSREVIGPGGGRSTTQDDGDHAVDWGLGEALVGFAVAIVASSVLAGLWLGSSGDQDLTNIGALFAQLGLWAGLLGAPLVATYRRGRRNLGSDFGFRFARRDGWGALAGAACQLAVFPVLYLVLESIIGKLDAGRPARELAARAAGWSFAVLAVLVTFLAPIIEELFYRGLVLRSLERRYGSTAAVVLSSAWFGASHFQVVQFPALFLLGVVLAVLTVRSGRLGAAVVAHVVFNGITMAILGLTG